MSRFTTKITAADKSCHNMDDTTVAILGAGIGSRIKSYEPRSLIKIGTKTLLEHQIFTICDCFESPEIITVVGCKAERVIKKIRGSVRIVENQLYETTVCNGSATIFSYGLPTKWCQIAYVTGKECKILKNIFNKFDSTHKKMLSFEILNKMISMGAVFKCHEPEGMSILEIDRIKDLNI